MFVLDCLDLLVVVRYCDKSVVFMWGKLFNVKFVLGEGCSNGVISVFFEVIVLFNSVWISVFGIVLYLKDKKFVLGRKL